MSQQPQPQENFLTRLRRMFIESAEQQQQQQQQNAAAVSIRSSPARLLLVPQANLSSPTSPPIHNRTSPTSINSNPNMNYFITNNTSRASQNTQPDDDDDDDDRRDAKSDVDDVVRSEVDDDDVNSQDENDEDHNHDQVQQPRSTTIPDDDPPPPTSASSSLLTTNVTAATAVSSINEATTHSQEREQCQHQRQQQQQQQQQQHQNAPSSSCHCTCVACPSLSSSSSALPPKWIELNVGGTSMITLRETFLCDKAKDSDLAVLALNSFSSLPKDHQGRPFLDVESRIFRHILNYLRGYPLTSGGIDASLTAELAAHFGLAELEERLGGANGATTSSSSPSEFVQRNNIKKRHHPSLVRFVRGPGVSPDGLVLQSSLIIARSCAPLLNHSTYHAKMIGGGGSSTHRHDNDNNQNQNNDSNNNSNNRYQPHGHRIVFKIDRYNHLHDLAIGLASDEVVEKFGGGPQNISNAFSVTEPSKKVLAGSVANIISGNKHSVMLLHTGSVYSCVGDDSGDDEQDEENGRRPKENKSYNSHIDDNDDRKKKSKGFTKTCNVLNQTNDAGNGMFCLEREYRRHQDENPDAGAVKNLIAPQNRPESQLPVDEARVFREGDCVEICVNYLKSVKNPKYRDQKDQSKRKNVGTANKVADEAETASFQIDPNQKSLALLACEGERQFDSSCISSSSSSISAIGVSRKPLAASTTTQKTTTKATKTGKTNVDAAAPPISSLPQNRETSSHLRRPPSQIPPRFVPGLMITISRMRVNTKKKFPQPIVPPVGGNSNNNNNNNNNNESCFEPSPPFSFFDPELRAVRLFNAVYTQPEFVNEANLHFVVVLGGQTSVSIEYAAHCYPDQVERDDDDYDDEEESDDDDEEHGGGAPREDEEEAEQDGQDDHHLHCHETNHQTNKDKYNINNIKNTNNNIQRVNSNPRVLVNRPLNSVPFVRALCDERGLVDQGGNRIMMIPRCISWENVVASSNLKQELEKYRIRRLEELHKHNKMLKKFEPPRPDIEADGEINSAALGYRVAS